VVVRNEKDNSFLHERINIIVVVYCTISIIAFAFQGKCVIALSIGVRIESLHVMRFVREISFCGAFIKMWYFREYGGACGN